MCDVKKACSQPRRLARAGFVAVAVHPRTRSTKKPGQTCLPVCFGCNRQQVRSGNADCSHERARMARQQQRTVRSAESELAPLAEIALHHRVHMAPPFEHWYERRQAASGSAMKRRRISASRCCASCSSRPPRGRPRATRPRRRSSRGQRAPPASGRRSARKSKRRGRSVSRPVAAISTPLPRRASRRGRSREFFSSKNAPSRSRRGRGPRGGREDPIGGRGSLRRDARRLSHDADPGGARGARRPSPRPSPPVGGESGSTDIRERLLVFLRFLGRSECF